MFGWFKKEKVKTLSLPDKQMGGFIQPLTSRLLEINLGEKLVVPVGYCAVIVSKDKPLDIFTAGEYDLSIPSLPKTTKALKLDKSKVKKKKGEKQIIFPTKFKCDLYFVNMAVFEGQEWVANRIYIKDKQCGKFNLSMSGKFSFQVSDVANTIKLFLLEWAFIGASKAQIRLKQYMGEFVGDAVEWGKVTNPIVLNDSVQMSEILSPLLVKKFGKYGIAISNFVVEKVDFGREVTAILEQKERENKPEEKEPDADITKEVTTQNNETAPNEVADNLQKQPKAEQQETQSISDSENAVVDLSILDSEIDKKDNEIQFVEKKPAKIDFSAMSDEDLLSKSFTKNKNKDTANTTFDNTKKCPKCGKIHSIDDQICECGCNLD